MQSGHSAAIRVAREAPEHAGPADDGYNCFGSAAAVVSGGGQVDLAFTSHSSPDWWKESDPGRLWLQESQGFVAMPRDSVRRPRRAFLVAPWPGRAGSEPWRQPG